MTQTRRSPAILLIPLLAVLAILMLVLVQRLPVGMPTSDAPTKDLPALTPHALKHADAQTAWDWVQHHGRFCQYDCPDGRTRFVCPMDDGRWAVVVLGRFWRLVTAFTCDQDYAKGIADECYNPWRYAHP